VLLMLYGLPVPRWKGTVWEGVAAFFATARFPALFPLLGSSAASGRRRWTRILLVLAVFLGAAALAWSLWGWDAIQVVYLGQFARANSESLNLFALLIHQGWVAPSLGAAAIQGGGLVLLVLWVHVRRYSPVVACAVPLIGVMVFSQYLNYHFLVWLTPLVLLGADANWWLLAYATLAAFNENVLYWYLALDQGIYWPYELCGIVLTLLLVALLVLIVRKEEARIRTERASGTSSPSGAAHRA